MGVGRHDDAPRHRSVSTGGCGVAGSRAAGPVLDEVRAALDDDLDTPRALAAIDDAAARGEDVRDAAALLGVDLRD